MKHLTEKTPVAIGLAVAVCIASAGLYSSVTGKAAVLESRVVETENRLNRQADAFRELRDDNKQILKEIGELKGMIGSLRR